MASAGGGTRGLATVSTSVARFRLTQSAPAQRRGRLGALTSEESTELESVFDQTWDTSTACARFQSVASRGAEQHSAL